MAVGSHFGFSFEVLIENVGVFFYGIYLVLMRLQLNCYPNSDRISGVAVNPQIFL